MVCYDKMSLISFEILTYPIFLVIISRPYHCQLLFFNIINYSLNVSVHAKRWHYKRNVPFVNKMSLIPLKYLV